VTEITKSDILLSINHKSLFKNLHKKSILFLRIIMSLLVLQEDVKKTLLQIFSSEYKAIDRKYMILYDKFFYFACPNNDEKGYIVAFEILEEIVNQEILNADKNQIFGWIDKASLFTRFEYLKPRVRLLQLVTKYLERYYIPSKQHTLYRGYKIATVPKLFSEMYLVSQTKFNSNKAKFVIRILKLANLSINNNSRYKLAMQLIIRVVLASRYICPASTLEYILNINNSKEILNQLKSLRK